MCKKIKVVVIDSGIDKNGPLNLNIRAGYNLKLNENGITIDDNYNDIIGHGTAVADILLKYNPNVEVIPFKIFDDEVEITSDKLIYVLDYINENIECDIINISLGLELVENISKLENTCRSLTSKGIVIISAFDNFGAISYPAAFDTVIGVDVCSHGLDYNEYEFIEGSVINILATNKHHRVKWFNNTNTIISGTSFSTPIITAKIALILSKGDITLQKLFDYLKAEAKNVYLTSDTFIKKKDKEFVSNIRKAILFPFNKEMHAISRFQDLIGFEIVDYYDIKYSLNINQPASTYTHGNDTKVIKNIIDLNWETDNFDSVILGHCNQLSKLVGRDILVNIINNCEKYNKAIYTFDDVSSLINKPEYLRTKVLCPQVNAIELPQYRMGKLHRVATPIIGVFGTSSQQGKFTLQLELRRNFKENGYKVGQIGTEPTSLLFGFDTVFPMGYNSSVYLNNKEAIAFLNEELRLIDLEENDLIIIGSQSGSVPFDFNNINMISDQQFYFPFVTNPDAMILCCNPHDDYTIITRSIKYLEGITSGKVICLCLFPVCYKAASFGSNIKKEPLKDIEKEEICKSLESKYQIPCFSLDESQKIYNKCINYLTD